jgi:hypothetical protein
VIIANSIRQSGLTTRRSGFARSPTRTRRSGLPRDPFDPNRIHASRRQLELLSDGYSPCPADPPDGETPEGVNGAHEERNCPGRAG